MLLTDGALKYVYGLGSVYAVDANGGVQVYHTHELGLARTITDASQTILETYPTDEIGIPAVTQCTGSQPFRFTGEQRDPTPGLESHPTSTTTYAPSVFTGNVSATYGPFTRPPIVVGDSSSASP